MVVKASVPGTATQLVRRPAESEFVCAYSRQPRYAASQAKSSVVPPPEIELVKAGDGGKTIRMVPLTVRLLMSQAAPGPGGRPPVTEAGAPVMTPPLAWTI